MINNEEILSLIEIPSSEVGAFENTIKEYRIKTIRTSSDMVEEVFLKNKRLENMVLKKSRISEAIEISREAVWRLFLKEEAEFNSIILRDLHKKLKTPEQIINLLIQKNITDKAGKELIESIKELCGEYAGRIYPYIYTLSLSNTQSRRSRSGATFESIIYKLYDMFLYKYDSQKKVGRKIFEQEGLGKKVDSVLPSLEAFQQRRNKTIIGTMKTSLRERWQEVIEEIERTKIPEIHLLTVDDSIALNKAKEMAKHNVALVVLEKVKKQKDLAGMKNIISFEKYFLEEIPNMMGFWSL